MRLVSRGISSAPVTCEYCKRNVEVCFSDKWFYIRYRVISYINSNINFSVIILIISLIFKFIFLFMNGELKFNKLRIEGKAIPNLWFF